MCDTPGAISLNGFFAVFRNKMEDRILQNKLGSINLEEKRLLRRHRSEMRLLKIKQEQRLGNLTTRRSEPNGVQLNRAGSTSPQSVGTSRQLDFTKMQLPFEKRQSSKSLDLCEEFPENEGDNTTFLTNDEWIKPSNRLPRLPSLDGKKTPEPMSPTSKDSCQSPVNQKPPWTPPTALQDGRMREGHEAKGNPVAVPRDITRSPRDKTSSPRARRQTWNGKPLPMVQQPVSIRKRSYSDRDQPSLCGTTESSVIHTGHQRCENAGLVKDLKTAWRKPSGLTKISFPTAEDAVLRRDFLALPASPVRKASSLSSLRSWESLPPVLENKSFTSEGPSNEADEATNKKAAGITCPLKVSEKKTDASQSCPIYQSAPVFVLPRHRQFRRQGNVTEVPISRNAPSVSTESSKESERADGEIGYGAGRKVSVRHKTSQTGNEQGQQEPAASKNSSTKREKPVLQQSKSLPPTLGETSRHEIRRDVRKKKESVYTKQKPSLDKDPENKEEKATATAPIDKSKWMKALRKVFNANMFLSGMAALHKQRELDRLALAQKQAELEQLYRDLRHCRYLRLPSKEDSEQTDSISWVFGKDESP